MEQEILETIKQKYNDMTKISKNDYSELEELEKNPVVQRYLYLKKLKESNEELAYHGASIYSHHIIIGNILDEYGNGKIKKTNNIWCYLFENGDAVVYCDIENKSRITCISKDIQEEFENTNKVVYGSNYIRDYSDRYYNTRYKFFNWCIEEGQEEAVNKVMEMKMYKKEE